MPGANLIGNRVQGVVCNSSHNHPAFVEQIGATLNSFDIQSPDDFNRMDANCATLKIIS